MNQTNTNNSKFNGHNAIRRLGLFFFTTLFLSTFFGNAQTNELAEHYISSSISLEMDNSVSKSTEQIIERKISEVGATWLRLYLKDVNLGKQGTLTITSDLDGATQTLNASSIQDWGNTTAYFNGNSITVKLTVPGNERAVGLSIDQIAVGEVTPNTKSQCGSRDDRVDADDRAIGRIVPIGCTGWIISNGKLVTAGHCVSTRSPVIEFQVPKSNSNGSIVHPGPEDQYPIGNFISPYPNNQSQANDWAVFTASPNTQTGLTPIEAQAKSYLVVQDDPGAEITITGFGVDTGSDNQTQQIHTGPFTTADNTFVSYRTDTTGGNSGSPIIDTATGNAVGVHAYGGCGGSGGDNSGERATIPAFWIAMGYGTPPPPPVELCSGDNSSYPFVESFEGALGSWSQSTIDDINWELNSGGTPSDGTGPSGAIDGNSYLYVEASGNGQQYPNKQAILNSPCLDFSSVTAPSFGFRYHMLGSAINSLTIEARTDNTGDWVAIFNRAGDQGNDWETASLDLSAYAGISSVQLRVKAITGSGSEGWQSDIAIDLLSITDGSTPPPPPPTVGCSDVVTSFPYTQSYEGSIGDWSQEAADDINWTVNSGGTPSSNTGPSSASNGNSYIYVEASGDGDGFPNKNAILNSPCFDFSDLVTPALGFDYHMLGSAINSLTVEVRTNNTGDWITVFSKTGAQGSNWNTAVIDLSNYEGEDSVQLRLNVLTGSGNDGWQSDIAIDAITIQEGGSTPPPPPPPACAAIDFSAFTINGFSNQDNAGDYVVTNGGANLELANNTWKHINMNYTVTANTIVEFDFSSTAQGEIHGIGFENDNTLTADRYFKVHGTQNYGVTNFDNYSGGTQSYVIPVGNFYTGAMNRLVFINDNDAGNGNTSIFSNVRIYEGSCGNTTSLESIIASLESVAPILGDEPEGVFQNFKLAPNPTKNNFSIYLPQNVKDASATIFSVLGQIQGKVKLVSGVNQIFTADFSLAKGVYLIRVDSKGESITEKLIIN